MTDINEFQFAYKGKYINISGRNGEYIFDQIKHNKAFYELDLLVFTNMLMSDSNGFIVDVGANLGNHTVFYGSQRENPIISIEPYQENFILLRKNCKQNRLGSRVTAFNCAAWNHEEALSLSLQIEGNLGSITSVPSEGGDTQGIPLDTILGSRSAALIKIDVEGGEWEVVQGALSTIERDLPMLSVEVHSYSLLWKLNKLLAPLGYILAGVLGRSDNYIWIHPKSYPDMTIEQLKLQTSVQRHRVMRDYNKR